MTDYAATLRNVLQELRLVVQISVSLYLSSLYAAVGISAKRSCLIAFEYWLLVKRLCYLSYEEKRLPPYAEAPADHHSRSRYPLTANSQKDRYVVKLTLQNRTAISGILNQEMDELQFCVQHHDEHIGVWRHQGERMRPAYILYRHMGLAFGVRIWVAIRTCHGHLLFSSLRIPLDGHLIKMKALKFYKELKESEPSTSSRESEVASADEEAARKYPEKLAKIIKDGEYCAHQVFNADETGLFWKKNANPNCEIKSQTLNACWKAAWPECVSKGNESNRAIVTSEIISIAKEIGGEGFDDFGEHDIEELLVDEALNDDDILESMVDITKDLETVNSEPEEDVTPLDEKLLREGLQLSGKLANFFIQNDNDVERALKFQRDLKFCMSGYRELYKELVPSQSLITDYLVKKKNH
ncbi:uncharacterized protein TNCV_3280321 [Trichonephila clavipes]|nr:uncharacterized protein TNCV_3280321 [Trichonephila clavipes]